LPTYNYNKIKEMGTEVYVAPDLLSTKFDIYKAVKLKLIPYQTSTSYQRVNSIAKYTEGIYTIWEAEGFDDTGAEIQLSYLPQNATLFSEGNINGIKSTGNPGYLISGPNYIQPASYSIDTNLEINYTVKFKIKVEPKNGSSVSLTNNSDIICRIEVLSNGLPLDTTEILAEDFGNYGEWIEGTLNYSKNNNLAKNTSHPIQTSYLESIKQSARIEIFSNVEFKVYFYGTGTDYLTLYVDRILVYDQRGVELMAQAQKQLDIIHQATNYNNINQFTTDQTVFDTTVVGWFAVDEPSFIDNFGCVKKVAELLKNNATNKKLVVSIAGSWNGRVYEGSNVFRIDELMKRTGIEDVIMNNLIFDYPYNDNTLDYANLNISNMLDNHLYKLNNYDVPFVLALQFGKWKALEGILEKTPTKEQLLYTMNAGLLYGAKGICISNYFFDSDYASNTTALYDFTLDEYSLLWDYIKNDLSPRLKGIFGRKIKDLQQLVQFSNVNANQSPVINYEYVYSVGTVNNTQELSCVLDLGFFSNSEDGTKYFMAVNRYYSEFENIVFNFQGLENYVNWEVTDFVTNTKVTIVTDNNNTANHSVSIPKGDAGLYGLVPIVKCGGTLISNEIITGSLKLGGNITVPTGVTLTIASGSTLNLNGYSIISTGGSIIQNGTLIGVNSYLKSGSTLKGLFPTIQAAITNASSYQSVELLSKTYSENISVTSKSYITINGLGTVSTILNGSVSITNSSNISIHNIRLNNTLTVNNSSHTNVISCNLQSSTMVNDFYGTQTNLGFSSGTYGTANFAYNSYGGTGDIYETEITEKDVAFYLVSNASYNVGTHDYFCNNLLDIWASGGAYAYAISNTYSYTGAVQGNVFVTGINNLCGGLKSNTESSVFDIGNFYEDALLKEADDKYLSILREMRETKEEETFSTYNYISLFTKLIEEYKSILEKTDDRTTSIYALRKILHLYKSLNQKETFYNYINDLLKDEKYFSIKANIERFKIWDLIDKSNYSEALSLVERLVKQSEKNSQLLCELIYEEGIIYKHYLENIELANGSFETIINNYPDHILSNFALAEISGRNAIIKKSSIQTNILSDEYSISNYPNPFNPVTTIYYSIPIDQKVTIKVYDILGKEIKILVNEMKAAGKHQINFDASQLASGVYIYSIQTENYLASKKMILMK
jgi:hypothetical protein